MNRETRSSYTYRIPLDDRKAMRKIHRLDVLKSGYDIRQIPKRDVPNGDAAKNWGVLFYESKEMRDFETDELTGGTIPGLHKYRYSLDWEPTPMTELIEMRHANGGGTRLKGEYYIGTHDPRLSDYAPVDFVVGWTPGEIKAMFDGEDVPNKLDYSHDPPMMDADDAMMKFIRMVQDHAHDIGFKKMREELEEYVDNCDHQHVVENDGRGGPVAYCEDCGHDWIDDAELDDAKMNGAEVVGTTA